MATTNNRAFKLIEILTWPNKRGKENRILPWFKEIEGHGYLVVLRKGRKGEIILITGYPTDQPHTQRKLLKEFEAYKSSKRRP